MRWSVLAAGTVVGFRQHRSRDRPQERESERDGRAGARAFCCLSWWLSCRSERSEWSAWPPAPARARTAEAVDGGSVCAAGRRAAAVEAGDGARHRWRGELGKERDEQAEEHQQRHDERRALTALQLGVQVAVRLVVVPRRGCGSRAGRSRRRVGTVAVTTCASRGGYTSPLRSAAFWIQVCVSTDPYTRSLRPASPPRPCSRTFQPALA